ERLASFLAELPAVRAVEHVRALHEVDDDGTVRRVIELTLALREPYMPAVLARGGRHRGDAQGRGVPGGGPAPAPPRPGLRGRDADSRPGVRRRSRGRGSWGVRSSRSSSPGW